MPDLLKEFALEYWARIRKNMTPEAEVFLKFFPEMLYYGLSPEERLKFMAEKRLKEMSLDEILAALPPDMGAALVERLKTENSAPKNGSS